MKTVTEVFESKAENKTKLYIDLANVFAEQARQYLGSESFMCSMSAQEVIKSYHKAESADCEYTAYANTYDAEKWLEKAVNSSL